MNEEALAHWGCHTKNKGTKAVVALQFSSTQHEVSRVKRARLLSQNQIQETVMDSDGDEKYYASEDMEDEEEPRPPSR
jgi:hypothetical protein